MMRDQFSRRAAGERAKGPRAGRAEGRGQAGGGSERSERRRTVVAEARDGRAGGLGGLEDGRAWDGGGGRVVRSGREGSSE